MGPFMHEGNLAPAPPAADRIANGEVEAPPEVWVFPPPTHPVQVADRLNREVFTNGAGDTIIKWWRESWWEYTGTHWVEVEELTIRKPIYDYLKNMKYRKGEDTFLDWAPTQAKIGNALEPLKICNHVPKSVTAPAWINKGDEGSATGYVPLRNCLYRLSTGETFPHTANLFSTWVLDFDYQSDAECPEWTKFVAET